MDQFKLNADNMIREELLKLIQEGYEDYLAGHYIEAEVLIEEFNKKHLVK